MRRFSSQRVARAASCVALRLQPRSRRMRVLFVDDYPGVIELYDVALGARGFEVVGASTAGQAITLAATQRFDAVVLDCLLPDGSGWELVKRMRAIPSLAGKPIVGISSYGTDAPRQSFDGFLTKPFHPKRLASLLRRLDGERVARA
jgi:CheY-like chemotaxis protein